MSFATPLEVRRPRARLGVRLDSVPLLLGLALTLVALLSLLYLSQTSSVAISGYDIQELEARRNQWEYRNEQLRLQIAQTKSLDRVEREAAQRLSMGAPTRVVFVQQPPPVTAAPPAESRSVIPAAVVQQVAEAARGWLVGSR